VELNKYIKEILIDKDNVIIANFGAFEKSYESARIDQITGDMYPPQVVLTFRPDLKIDSGVLSKYIAEKEAIDETKAVESINLQVDEWNKVLDSGTELVLEYLGTLQKNPEGEYTFKPTVSPLEFPETYGLESISVQEKTATVIASPETNDAEKITATKTEKVVKKPVKISVKPIKPKNDEPPRSYKKLIVGLLIGLPFAALIIFGALNFGFVKQKFNDTTEYFSKLFEKKPTVDKITPTDTLSLADSINFETETVLQNYTIVNSANNARIEPKIENFEAASKIYIIAGSYKVKEYANRQKSILSQKGFNAEVLPVNNGLYRVAVASFNDIKTTVADMERLKSIDETLNLWILVDQ
jgi:nucleoid DNA-binding protein